MLKKALILSRYFCLIFLPVVAVSFWAYTVFHQVVVLISVILAAWLAYHISAIRSDRDRLGREVFLMSYELKKSKEALESCLATDTQTQVYNARLLDVRLTEECDRARRYRRPLSFMLVTIDSLLELTKAYGESLVEVVVHEVAEFLKESTRSVDIVIRQGSEQFIVILPETQLNQARIVAERIRYGIEKNTFRVEGKALKITVSVGFTSFDASIYRGKDDVIDVLERTMLSAKKAGPNHIATLATETI